MDRITGANWIYDAYGKRIFTDGPPATTVPATWLTGIQEEIMTVIEGAGLAPSINDNTQLKQAIDGIDFLQPGMIVGHGYIESTAILNSTAIVPYDDTIPQITEGDQLLSISYTPKYADSILFVEGFTSVGVNTAGGLAVVLSLFKNAEPDSIRTVAKVVPATFITDLYLGINITVSNINPITFYIRIGGSAASGITVNGMDSNRKFGGALSSWIKVTEIIA